jgi:hypothetical protein
LVNFLILRLLNYNKSPDHVESSKSDFAFVFTSFQLIFTRTDHNTMPTVTFLGVNKLALVLKPEVQIYSSILTQKLAS